MNAAQRRGKRDDRELELERLRLANDALELKYKFWTFTTVGLLTIGALAVCIPIARAVAGHDTQVSVTITLAATITLSITTAGASANAYWQRSRSRTAERRVDSLTSRLTRERDEHAEDKTRLVALEGDLAAVRRDHELLHAQMKIDVKERNVRADD